MKKTFLFYFQLYMVVSEYYSNHAVYLNPRIYSPPLLTAKVSDWTLDFLVFLDIEVISW
jgi:hypothetical protein